MKDNQIAENSITNNCPSSSGYKKDSGDDHMTSKIYSEPNFEKIKEIQTFSK